MIRGPHGQRENRMSALRPGVVRIAWMLVALVAAATCLSGCSGAGGRGGAVSGSGETTPGQFPETRPAAASKPASLTLDTPVDAVRSYLDWTSYAFRILDSDVASMTFDPYEEVRVNSYVELNRQKNRALDQRLVGFDVRSETSQGETSTLVAASEKWVYRYIDVATGAYATPVYSASYDTTYTVVRSGTGLWVVASVDASSTGGPVQ